MATTSVKSRLVAFECKKL